jgi:hypothetical protein
LPACPDLQGIEKAELAEQSDEDAVLFACLPRFRGLKQGIENRGLKIPRRP